MQMRLWSRTPTLAIGIILLLAACGGQTSTTTGQPGGSASPGPGGNTLTIAMSGDIETLDPAMSHFQRSNEVIYNIYDQWFLYDTPPGDQGIPTYDPTTILGSAIDSWTMADDNRSVVLHVREGMTFHRTGNPVTADDVAYWFERAQGLETGPAANMSLSKIDSWRKISDMEVEVTFSDVPAYFFFMFRDQASGLLDSVDIKANAAQDDPWGTEYVAQTDVASGEYEIESQTPGSELVLRAFDGYWGEKPYFDRIVIKIVPAEADRALLLQQGAVDIAQELSTDTLASLEGTEGVNVLSIKSRNQIMMGLNVTKEPFIDTTLRQAVAYAIPFERIVEEVYENEGIVSQGVIPVLGAYHDPETYPYKYDPDISRELLAEAGHPDGFEFTVHLSEGNATIEQAAVFVQTSLREVGIEMGIEVESASQFAESQDGLEVDAWMRDLLWYVDDPGYIGGYIGSSTTCCFKTGYSKPELDEIIGQLQVLTPEQSDEKAALATQYQEIFNDDSPVIFLGDLSFQIAMREDIGGYTQLADNLLWYFSLNRAD